MRMICESVSVQDATETTSQLTSAETRILEVDTLSRSLRVKLMELSKTIREARTSSGDAEIVEVLEADLQRTKEQYRGLLGIPSRDKDGGESSKPKGSPDSEERYACENVDLSQLE